MFSLISGKACLFSASSVPKVLLGIMNYLFIYSLFLILEAALDWSLHLLYYIQNNCYSFLLRTIEGLELRKLKFMWCALFCQLTKDICNKIIWIYNSKQKYMIKGSFSASSVSSLTHIDNRTTKFSEKRRDQNQSLCISRWTSLSHSSILFELLFLFAVFSGTHPCCYQWGKWPLKR